MPRSALIEVMVRAVMKAARGLRRDFGEVAHLQVSKKGTSNFVSTADLNAERVLFEELSRARPKFGFLMEESGEKPGEDDTHRWIIDPLDGTTNFLHAMPYFCISIALEKKLPDGRREIIAAVVYDPIRDEMFTAEKGGGAFLNDHRLRVSARKDLEHSLLATVVPRLAHDEYKRALGMMNVMTASLSGVRSCGAAALDMAYVAAGRYDGLWCCTLKAWDIAAGILLVKEAGGEVTEINGGADMLQSGCILASNGLIHKKVGALLQDFA